MTAVNIIDEIWADYRGEALRRHIIYEDGKANVPALINKVLKEQLPMLQKEVVS